MTFVNLAAVWPSGSSIRELWAEILYFITYYYYYYHYWYVSLFRDVWAVIRYFIFRCFIRPMFFKIFELERRYFYSLLLYFVFQIFRYSPFTGFFVQ